MDCLGHTTAYWIVLEDYFSNVCLSSGSEVESIVADDTEPAYTPSLLSYAIQELCSLVQSLLIGRCFVDFLT